MPFIARRALCRALLPLAVTLVATGCASSVSLDEPIEGRTWRLASIDNQAVIPSEDPRQAAQVQFSGQQVSGSGGCNRFTGSYQRDGRKLKIGPLAATRMACLDAQRGQLEQRFLAALQNTTGYSLAGTELVLLDARGVTLAKLDSSR